MSTTEHPEDSGPPSPAPPSEPLAAEAHETAARDQACAHDDESATGSLSLLAIGAKDEPSGGLSGPQLTHAIVLLLMTISSVMVLWNLQLTSLKNANTGSRYATIESLVDRGTYYINKSQYMFTVDKMKVEDKYISSKPPTLPTYAAGAYWMFKKITGYNIRRNEGAVVWWVSLCTGWLAHWAFMIYLYRLSRLLMSRQLAIIGTIAAGGFGYLGVAYATAINNHSTSAALGIVGFYYAVRIRREQGARMHHWVVSGLAFGFMTAVDLTSGAFMLAGLLYLGTYDWRRTLLLFAPALVPGVLTHQLLNYSITGSMIPTYLNRDLKQFADNYFKYHRTGIDALKESKHIYAFNALLGHHGLFSMTPLFFFSAWEFVHAVRKRVALPETLFALGVVGAFLAFYIFRSSNYGGWCVGMRHLVPIMPMFVLFFGLFLERVRLGRTLGAAMLVAFAISSFNVQDGLTSPFQFSVWHNWLEGKPNRGRVVKRWRLAKDKKKSDKNATKKKNGREKKSAKPGKE